MKPKTLRLAHVFMTAGAVLIILAMALLIYNNREAQKAEKAAVSVMPDIISKIEETAAEEPVIAPADSDREMTETEIDGHNYIGYLTVPALSAELPVMSEYTEYQLKLAPCRQKGTADGNDLVIAGHNYRKHFGSLSKLGINDLLQFTDMDGKTIIYKVCSTFTVPPEEGDAVLESPWDLVLYTCTYSGRERIAVGCGRLSEDEMTALAEK